MKPWPVQPRAGFTGLPNEILARAIGALTGDQLRLFLGLVYGAQWKAEGTVSPDGRWRVGWGQALVSYDALAAAYGLGVDAVRRGLRRFEALALATSRRASPATSAATSGATPPTLVDFGSWYGFQPAPKEATASPATPPATQPTTPPAPIQHRNTRTQEHPAAAARDQVVPGPDPLPNPHLAQLVEALDAAGLGLALPKSKPGQNAQAIKGELDQLVAKHGVDALVRHVQAEQGRRAVAGAPRIGSLTPFAGMWAAPGFSPPAAPQVVRFLEGAPAGCDAWAVLRDRLAGKLRPDLYQRWFAPVSGERANGSLVLKAPDDYHRAFLIDNYLALLATEAHALLGDVNVEVTT